MFHTFKIHWENVKFFIVVESKQRRARADHRSWEKKGMKLPPNAYMGIEMQLRLWLKVQKFQRLRRKRKRRKKWQKIMFRKYN